MVQLPPVERPTIMPLSMSLPFVGSRRHSSLSETDLTHLACPMFADNSCEHDVRLNPRSFRKSTISVTWALLPPWHSRLDAGRLLFSESPLNFEVAIDCGLTYNPQALRRKTTPMSSLNSTLVPAATSQNEMRNVRELAHGSYAHCFVPQASSMVPIPHA